MRVLITTKRFPSELPATAVLGKEFAEELGRQGCQVTGDCLNTGKVGSHWLNTCGMF